jgi:predicted RNA-binding protein YlqC (UPF0109 family)
MSARDMTVTIDYARHYQHPTTGQTVPSVTTVLGALDKSALLNWAVDETATYAVDNLHLLTQLDRRAALELVKGARWRKTGEAADKGTDAHSILEDLARDVIVLNNNHNSWVLNCWDQLSEEFEIEVLEAEPTFWNGEIGYAGSADLVARVNGELAVLDYKTSGSGVYGETSLQLAAYAMSPTIIRPDGTEIDFRATYGEVQRTYTVWLRPEDNGKYVGKAGWSLLPMRYDDVVWRAFRATRIAWEWLNVDSKVAVGKPMNSTHIGSKRRKARKAA